VRSGPGEARTILLFHIISARPSKQPLMVRTFLKIYMELYSYFVAARTNKRHHHHCRQWFFVLCNRHWFNRVPGSSLGIDCLPFALTLMLAVTYS
jgi:hypothetical protein